ncbi:MAG: AAA family ATPase, partial [Phormidesmis sp.]
MHVKRVELSNFKSFGGTTDVPLLPGFTVISGPNGSGKSNILDSLLFCLGLASSRGMRAERLPDLVNQNQAKRRSTVETIVTATFDISDVVDKLISNEETEDSAIGIESDTAGDFQPLEASENGLANGLASDAVVDDRTGVNGAAKNGHNGNGNGNGQAPVLQSSLPTSQEWKVTRRLRVTAQGTYTSNYYIDDEPCTLNDLHEQLQRFRIYPEGYNVVLQGDVTSIISMNARERREIIDEMAGVASFDRKINQAKSKLDVVKDREERFRIVETELIAQLERLDQDRKKAEKYKQIKATLQEKQRWEGVMHWRSRQKQAEQLASQI